MSRMAANTWFVLETTYYIRDISGREIAIYNTPTGGSTALEWNLWGLGNEGKIKNSGDKYFYVKDHLGTSRVVLDSANTIVAAYDYDAWGYPLENRIYEAGSYEQEYKFTGKERDLESNYDYFGARYYDSKIGRWGGVEPMLELYFQFTPYGYSVSNPLKYIDIDGEKLVLGGETAKSLEYLKSMLYTSDQDRITVDGSGVVSFDVTGLDVKSDAAFELINNLVTSSESFLFEVTEKTYGLSRETGEEIETDFGQSHTGEENYSVNPRNINGGTGGKGLLPKEGFSGQVSLGTGYWTFPKSNTEQPKHNIVFHALAENYHRTVGREPYMRKSGSGAHKKAVEDAKNFKKQVGTPGEAGRYVHKNN